MATLPSKASRVPKGFYESPTLVLPKDLHRKSPYRKTVLANQVPNKSGLTEVGLWVTGGVVLAFVVSELIRRFL